jgi:AraC-like DNA-binding protein
MVSIRCKTVVKEELEKLGLHYTMVELGEAEILESLSEEQHDQIKLALLKSGLELLDGKKRVLVQKIKNLIIEAVHHSEEPFPGKLSEQLSQKLNHDYTYLANVFSEMQGITIEKFYISHKIERVKELLSYNELTLTEIAYKLHYSSVAHLSTQFKKVTGLTPSHFKDHGNNKRFMLEDL